MYCALKLIKGVSYGLQLCSPQSVGVGGVEVGLMSVRNTMSGLGDVVDEKTEEEVRVLTPEVDAFMRMPIGGGVSTYRKFTCFVPY